MAYSVVPVARFAGLDLTSSPDESACIDMLNVDLDVRGAVRSRDGFDNFTGSELTNQPDSVFPFTTSAGTKRLLVGNGTRVDVLNTSATVVVSLTGLTGDPWSYTRFGGPTREAVYLVNGVNQARRFDSDTFTGLAASPADTHKFVAVTPTSNRLVIARGSGTVAGNNPSSVNFSDAGTPETFTATNYVDLDPGDGEAITGLVAWREYLFIFKESKVWVHFSESTDATGEPIFNFKKVNTGVGLVASRALAAGRDGVYFLGRRGVYRMTGPYAPELVSDRIAPLFIGGLGSHYQGSAVTQGSITAAAMTFHNERIYLALPTGVSTTNDRLLVFDPRYDEWIDWNIPAAALCPFAIGNSAELVFAYPTGSNYIGRHSSSYTDDDGSSITSRYRTGFSDLGAPGQEKDIDSTRLWGTGSVGVAGSRDFDSLDTATTVTLGTSPAIDRGLHNKQKKGELISYQLASVSGGAWRVHRYAHYLRGSRPPGVAS